VLCDPKWGEHDLRNGGTALEMIHAESFGLAKQCDDFVKARNRRKDSPVRMKANLNRKQAAGLTKSW